MRQLLLGLALLAIPTGASAFERMERQACIDGFIALAEMMGPGETDTMPFRMGRAQVVTADGWCRMRGRAGVREDAPFDELDWRAEGLDRWTRDGIPPLALELRMTGLDPDEMQGGIETDRPPLGAYLLLRQVPEAGQVLLERFELGNVDGDMLAGSAVFDRVYLSSRAMVQVSAGSIALRGALLDVAFSGKYENPFALDLEAELRGNPQAQRDAAFRVLSALPDGVLDNASRAELTGFVGALPAPLGRLELSFQSTTGIGFAKVGLLTYMSFVDGGDASDMEAFFDGVTIRGNWTPAEGQAD